MKIKIDFETQTTTRKMPNKYHVQKLRILTNQKMKNDDTSTLRTFPSPPRYNKNIYLNSKLEKKMETFRCEVK